TLGLIQAVDRFDPARGLKLKTLAEFRIRGAMVDYLRELDPLPRSIRQFARRRDETSNLLAQAFNRSPSESELAEALGIRIERYRRLSCIVRSSQTRSLEELGPLSRRRR